MDVTSCPECGVPAEITERFAMESTGGLVEHVRTLCARRHWFLLSVAALHAAPGAPLRPDAVSGAGERRP